MRVITTPELSFLADELKEFTGFYIDRFYEVAEGRFRIKVSRRGGAQANIQIVLSRTVNKTAYIEKQEHASSFALAVRKRIEGFIIDEVSQYNEDRMLLFKLHRGDVETDMIVEMFGKGNLILIDNDAVIQLAYKVHDFRDRKIRTGEKYTPPKKAFATGQKAGPKTPVIYRKEGMAVDYSVAGEERAGFSKQGFGTLQELLDVFYHENPAEEKKEMSKAEKLIEELLASIRKQSSGIESLDEEIAQNREKGGILMKNMDNVNALVGTMQANKRMTKEGLQAHSGLKILNVDLKDKTIELEI